MRIAIRADASLQMGSGHVMRCLALAEALRANGAAVRFVCRHLPESLAALVRQHGHELALLPAVVGDGKFMPSPGDPPHAAWLGVDQARDARETRDALADCPHWDWLVVDHYGLDARWEGALRPVTDAILVIDDLADRPHDCNVLLDQNYYENSANRYDNRVPAGCSRLLGPRYALIRSEFRELRRNVVPRDGAVRRLLVFFGGMDPGNATGVALEAISRLDRSALLVDVVIGKEHPACREIELTCRELGLSCHVQTPHMARLIAEADLAIGAGGTATWERCAFGLPTMTFCLADNQRLLVNDGSRAGLIYAPDIKLIDVEGVLLHLRALLANTGLRNLISRNCLGIVDAFGASRVARQLGVTAIEIRPAGESDSDNLLAWRNHPSVRAVSHDTEPISREAHAKWLALVLSDPQRQLLIGNRKGLPVGVVRFDLSGDAAEVSIYLVPGADGHGDGGALLVTAERWLSKTQPHIGTIRANVLRDNMPSHRLFAGCGYVMQTTHYIKRIHP